MVARSIVHDFGGPSVFLFNIGDFNEPMRVMRFSGSEGLSSLFEFQVELVCENLEIDFAQVVGKPALLAIRGEAGWRYLNGIISHFEQLHELPHHAIYQATVVPLVWRLLHRHDCRIFQKLDTPAILKKVFEVAGVPADRVSFNLSSNYEPRDYCVQYRESDWTFACRLMEEDGIFYFFDHFEDKHVLVLGDGKPALKPIEGTELLPFRRNMGTVVLEDHIHRFRFTQEVRPGKATLRDYKFKQPDLDMEVGKAEEVDADLEVYDYPGEYLDPGQGSTAKGKTLARVRLESFQATRRVAQGESDCERLMPGRLFTLAEHSRGDYNGRYLITAVSHQGSQPQVLEELDPGVEPSYSNHFSCMPEKVPYRPARVTPRPYVKGGQTAVVVGPAGEEIYVDEWGRVKVQFHWDRQGKLDENSSCWIRVSQLWAGELWGRMFIPRIGQEVIVDFIEGDPDRPIITGRVYNGANIVPYQLPEEKTKSTIKSNSSLGKEGFNELRFEDKKGEEQLFIHAERNMDVHVKNDSLENILHDRHQTIGREGRDGKVGDQNELIFRDKSLTVHRHGQEHIGGDFKRLVGGVDGEGNVDVVIKADRKELVHKDSHLHVKQNLNEQVDVTQSLEVGKDLHVVVGQVDALEAGQEIHLKSSKIVIEAAEGLTLKALGGFITINSGGIAIKGNVVLINSGGSALSGSGASPTSPKDAAEAQPTRPTPADEGRVPPKIRFGVSAGIWDLTDKSLQVTKTALPKPALEPIINTDLMRPLTGAPLTSRPLIFAESSIPTGTRTSGGPLQTVPPTCEQLAKQIRELRDAHDRALLADHVYDPRPGGKPLPPDIILISDDPQEMFALFKECLTDAQIQDLVKPEGSSYCAAIYRRNKDGKIFLVFRGTTGDFPFSEDWAHNGIQGIGLPSSHYTKAVELSKTLRDHTGVNNLEIIGHSKGGGMAAAGGLATGAKTTIFNPAGLHSNTINNLSQRAAHTDITSYIVEGEILDYFQTNPPPRTTESVNSPEAIAPSQTRIELLNILRDAFVQAAPDPVGRRVYLPADWGENKWPNPITFRSELHHMDKVIASITAKEKDLMRLYSQMGCEAKYGKP